MLLKEGCFNNRVARQLANTVATWHIAGAVHGDLKWSNILMQEDSGETRFFIVDLDQTSFTAGRRSKV